MQGAIHSISEAEKMAFTHHVNDVLQDDYDMKGIIPINEKQIFNAVQDGVILCKIINQAVPGRVPPISPQAINIRPTNTYQKIENLNLAIQSSKSIGCTVVNVRNEFILEKREHIVLGLIWQVIKIHLANQIHIKRHPEIFILKKEQEQPEIMQKMHYEEVLLRWLNWHIKRAGGDRQVKNFGNDLKDSYAYGHVMNNICSTFDNKFWTLDDKKKAEQIIQYCHKEHIKTSIRPEDILSNNQRLHQLLCAHIFNQKHGLEMKEKKIVQLPPEPETDETRQMRIYKNWINSMGIEGVYVNHLMDDLRDGRILLSVIDRLRPKSVDWEKKYSNKLHSRIHIVQNCNYVIEICKQKMNVKIVQIGGVDIVDAKVNLTLGLVWQLCKVYWEQRVGQISDEQLVKWGNEKVPSELRIKSLKDKSLSNCMFFLKLIASIEPKGVDFNRLKEGDSEDAVIARNNYTISCARKLGAQVMMLWEHIRESNSKFIYTFMAELQRVSRDYKAKH